SCPVCGKEARRETDTMDTFVDSSWYFMRYCCPQEQEQIFNEEVDYWMPIDQYIGGIEHAILHLLYARFWTKVTRDLDLIKIDEPFTKLLTQGMVLNQTFFRESNNGSVKKYFNPCNVILDKDNKGRVVSAKNADDGLSVQLGKIEKMSKSKNNGVDPTVLIEKYGADTCRLFTMFAAPPENTLEWSEDGVEGSFRFVKRLWAFHVKKLDLLETQNFPYEGQTEITENGQRLKKACHEILSQASYDMERFQFNTVVSAAMKLLNTIDLFLQQPNCNQEQFVKDDKVILVESFSILLRILYPIAPHICCHIWRNVGYENVFGTLVDSEWPIVDEKALQQDYVDITIQINGKSRGRIKIPSSASEEQVLKIAQESKEYQRYCQTKEILRTIVVPNRLINIVLKI
ncbi:class I tRNA ligase family protein, partial [Betaproteobacteria bacterium]|nr:class I tRNA ligase family protein [Betaproteobacteria bacterium]